MKIRPAQSTDLDYCMQRVTEVADRPALIRYLEEHYGFWNPTDANVTIEPYGFDERIGWDTYLVCVDGKAAVFTDGPLGGPTTQIITSESVLAALTEAASPLSLHAIAVKLTGYPSPSDKAKRAVAEALFDLRERGVIRSFHQDLTFYGRITDGSKPVAPQPPLDLTESIPPPPLIKRKL